MMDTETKERIERLRALGDGYYLGEVASVFMGKRSSSSSAKEFRDSLIDLLERSDPDEWTYERLREYGLVRLPRDKDGVIIHVGDTVWSEDGMEWTVDHTCIGSMLFSVFVSTGDGVVYARDPNTITHHPPVTVESVLRELIDRVCDVENPVDEDYLIPKYAKRLRLTEEE